MSLDLFETKTPLALLAGSYLQAVGRPGPSLAVSLTRPAALVALVVLLPAFWGFDGFLAAGPVSDSLGVIAAGMLVAADTSLWRKGRERTTGTLRARD